ncbi:MAG: hypothetical protein AAF526_05075 [Pseudomonadota bacterium]
MTTRDRQGDRSLRTIPCTTRRSGLDKPLVRRARVLAMVVRTGFIQGVPRKPGGSKLANRALAREERAMAEMIGKTLKSV